MPNWCMTQYTIRNKEKEPLEAIKNEFEESQKINTVKNDYGNKWLGNVLLKLGFSEDDVLNNIPCRGSFELDPNIDFDEETGINELHIFTETAWEPMPAAILKMVDKYAPGSEILYFSEEPISECFITNDPNLAGMPYGGDAYAEEEDDDLINKDSWRWKFVPLEEL